MQGIRKAIGVFLMFFGMVTSVHLVISLVLLSDTYAELGKAFGIGEVFDFSIIPLGIIITEFVLGFELSCGLLTKEGVLEKPKPMDKGTKVLIYGLPFAIATGFLLIFFVLVLPSLFR